MDFDWTNPFLLEMKSAHIVSEQAKHGCQFDRRKASFYVHVLTERIVNIDKELIPLLPPMLNKGTSYAKPFKLNGQFMKWPGEYASRVGLERSDVGGPFSAMWYTPFDPSKTDRVKQVMLDLGWIPTEWNSKKMPFNVWSYRKRLEKTTYTNFIKNLTDRQERESYMTLVEGFMKAHFVNKSKGYMRAVLVGLGFDLTHRVPTFDNIRKKLLLNPFWPSSPKITEDSFDSLDDSQSRTLQLLRQRMVWAHRRSLIVGLIEQIRDDGKLSGEMNPCATPTARARHRIIVNIPAAGAPFGQECRSLFTGDKRQGERARVVKKSLKEGFRVKPLTNILQEWNSKDNEWEDVGHHKTLIQSGHEAFVGGDGAALTSSAG